jgi:hypothetical protein
VHDRERGDGAGDGARRRRRCFDRLELASRGAVDDLPAGFPQALPNRVGGGEIPRAAKLDALVGESLSFCLIRSSWL